MMLLMGWHGISEVVSDAVAKVDVWGWAGEVGPRLLVERRSPRDCWW
jgi:hypothetical protein